MTLGAKKKALFRIRRYARRSASARLAGHMQTAQRWDDEVEKVYSEGLCLYTCSWPFCL